MQNRNKTLATIIAILLVSTMAISLIAIQPVAAAQDNATIAAKAAGMKWDFTGSDNYNASTTRLLMWNRWKDQVPTAVFVSATPKQVGVGQEMTFIFFNPQVPSPSSDRYLFTLTITKPDGSTETLPPAGAQGVYTQSVQDGKFVSDSTGSGWTTWSPTQVGNHSVTVKFWGTAVPHTGFSSSSERDWYGVTLKESTFTTTFTVLQEYQQPAGWSPIPLPTEFWSRPIDGQNTDWWQISSNWLNNAHDKNNGGYNNKYQPDGIAPNSGHILWTKPTEDGGVVGGGSFSVPGEVFNAGHQYQTRFPQIQIIMHGRFYYRESNWYSASPGDYVCVDLQTGQEIWRNATMAATPEFGYYYDNDDMNQHGVVEPSWLFSNDFGMAIHPRTGISQNLTLSTVPSDTSEHNHSEIYGPKGEDLRYVLNNAGSTSNPDWRLVQWNSSRVFITQTSGLRNGSIYINNNLDWNVSISPKFSSGNIRAVIYNDIILISNGSIPSSPSYTIADYATFYGISLKPESRGQLIWGPTNIPLINTDNQQLMYQAHDPINGVFMFQQTPDMSWVGYDIYTGQKKWQTLSEGDYNPYAYYISSTGYNPEGWSVAYGKLYSTGYVGMVFAYDTKTGDLVWKQDAPSYMEKFEYYTLMINVICDGKIYIGTHEHSADTPLFKGSHTRVYNATTGELIWAMTGWANPYTTQIGDGVLTYWNNYDDSIYAVGKGPSQLTVSVANDVVSSGNSVMVKGNIIDISAGTKQKEQAARFPNGVPAVGDAGQSEWMEYVYMQKPRPTNTTGLPITLSVVDSNGNYRQIGTATSDADGFFSYAWMPDIDGKFTVYASFSGSESYWPSHAVTAFNVDPAPATPTPAPTAPASVADTYFVPAIVALFVVIVAIGVVTMLMVRKRP